MSYFEDFCKKFEQKRERDAKYVQLAESFISSFASGFAKFIEAPKRAYTVGDPPHVERHEYVEWEFVDCKGSPLTKGEHYCRSSFDAEGYLCFMLYVTCETKKVRNKFSVPCALRPLSDDAYMMRVGLSQRECKCFTQGQGKCDAEEYIVQLIFQGLDADPFSRQAD